MTNIFVQSTVNRASTILGGDLSKDKKIEELKLSDVNFNEDLELLKRLIDS